MFVAWWLVQVGTYVSQIIFYCRDKELGAQVQTRVQLLNQTASISVTVAVTFLLFCVTPYNMYNI